jgi:hypothetical protein
MRNVKIAHKLVTIASGTAAGTSDTNRIDIEGGFETITGMILYVTSAGGIKPRVGLKNGDGQIIQVPVNIDHLTGSTSVPPEARFVEVNFKASGANCKVVVEWDSAPTSDLVFDFLLRTENISA